MSVWAWSLNKSTRGSVWAWDLECLTAILFKMASLLDLTLEEIGLSGLEGKRERGSLKESITNLSFIRLYSNSTLGPFVGSYPSSLPRPLLFLC